MPVIEEGRHRFEFPDTEGWYAFKYDEINDDRLGFYRQRAEPIKYRYADMQPESKRKGEGIRGVDIVAGIGPEFRELVMLEIKDFSKDVAGLEAKVESGEIPAVIVQKALHTWGALCLGARNQDDLLPAELRVGILHPPKLLRVVFFLAQESIKSSPRERDTRQKEYNRRAQRRGIRTKLLNLLRPLGLEGDLADVDDLPRHCGWTVTELP
jgi:hypothetical protein